MRGGASSCSRRAKLIHAEASFARPGFLGITREHPGGAHCPFLNDGLDVNRLHEEDVPRPVFTVCLYVVSFSSRTTCTECLTLLANCPSSRRYR